LQQLHVLDHEGAFLNRERHDESGGDKKDDRTKQAKELRD
jgi:hypothetical protein